jgi:hypothetical protein
MYGEREIRDILQRLVEKVARANAIRHSGGRLVAKDWAELYALEQEAKAILADKTNR